MHDGFVVNWTFGAQDSLAKVVQEQRPEEAHRWPLLQAFDAKAYAWRDSHLALILRGKLSGIPTMGDVEPMDDDAPTEAPAQHNLAQWHEYLREKYAVGPRDMAIIVPTIGSGPKVSDDWAEWSQDDKELWNVQLIQEANRHLEYLRQLDARKGATMTDVPAAISESLATFRRDHPDSEHTGFLMMRLVETPAHEAITKAVRDVGAGHGLTIVRADDKEYHSDLFPNVLTYIYGCGFGIAVFERIEEEKFNPNVSLEVGYMLALNKRVCFLKDRTLKALHTDLIGKLYRPFDPQAPAETIPGELTAWLRDYEITKPGGRS